MGILTTIPIEGENFVDSVKLLFRNLVVSFFQDNFNTIADLEIEIDNMDLVILADEQKASLVLDYETFDPDIIYKILDGILAHQYDISIDDL